MTEPSSSTEVGAEGFERDGVDAAAPERRLQCDRCGAFMFEERCKILCLNCGNRFDCSDLNLYFD